MNCKLTASIVKIAFKRNSSVLKKKYAPAAMFLIKALYKVHSPQVLHGEGKHFAGKWVSKSVTEPSALSSKHCAHWCTQQMFRKESDDNGRQVERVITQGDTVKMGTSIRSAQIREKSMDSHWEPIQKSPCKRQQICYCRMNAGRCCHVDQRLALRSPRFVHWNVQLLGVWHQPCFEILECENLLLQSL